MPAEDTTFIDTLFREQKELVAFLQQQGELSFSVNVEALLSKTLLLSVASFFESRITTAIADYAGRVSNMDEALTSHRPFRRPTRRIGYRAISVAANPTRRIISAYRRGGTSHETPDGAGRGDRGRFGPRV